MTHLNVGVFHDDVLVRELGKKGTESDIAMFNRKSDDFIFTFMSPVGEKLSAKSQIISTIDAAIVVFSQMSRELGETIVMLDLLGVTKGFAITSPYAPADRVNAIVKGTGLESYRVEENEPTKVLELLRSLNPERDSSSPLLVIVDHSFSVKGVGEVVLGFVRKGVVRKYDKLKLLPANHEVIVRSIQVQDEDCEAAGPGTRVGLALKGAKLDELERGSVLTTSGDIKSDTRLHVSFTKSSFYGDDVRAGVFHATLGMQTMPITIAETSEDSLTIESSKPIVHGPQDPMLLLDLNAKKTRVIGKGIA